MAFPLVGVIAPAHVISQISQAAARLGVQIKSSTKTMSAEELSNFGADCKLFCIEPDLISTAAIRSAESAGVVIYPSSKLLDAVATIELSTTSGEQLAILSARSAHAQSVIWPISLINNDLVITPAPGVSEEQAITIAVSNLNLLAELALTGAVELLVDANDYQKLLKINWLQPISAFATQINSVTDYYEQYLRAILDLPLGDSGSSKSYTVTGFLKTDPQSDDYRPYLHLMARNPNLKFDQRSKIVGLSGENLESLLTEVIHAQQYYSGEIDS